MVKSYLRGHEIEFVNNEWVYSDTKESTIETHKTRACGFCNKMATPEGHDACLGTLPGLMNACCGHGEENEAYVQFLDKNTIHGKDAAAIMDLLKKHS